MKTTNMKKFWTNKKAIITGSIILVAFIGLVLLIMRLFLNYHEIQLRKQIEGEKLIYQQNFDMMYKKIAQITQVTEQNYTKNKEAFVDIYPMLISGRYKNNQNVVMNWIQESNPQWDLPAITDAYNKLSTTIDVEREKLFEQETKLTDLVKQREGFVEFWGSFFISNTEKIELTLINSKHTKEVFLKGEDNDINVFKN